MLSGTSGPAASREIKALLERKTACLNRGQLDTPSSIGQGEDKELAQGVMCLIRFPILRDVLLFSFPFPQGVPNLNSSFNEQEFFVHTHPLHTTFFKDGQSD